ncbi:COG1361 S-layer family protein [Halarchaeum sp. P4]|uniref:COG1361 S-layer family protein n=1 Tax=Halarchaeum sp. P4 TaxID=3421639 RepID=UPI003EBA0440
MKRALLVCLLVGLVAAPTVAVADELSPALSATLGDDDVSPGQEATLTVSITNSPEIYSLQYSPNATQAHTTARHVKATMKSGSAPIDVKTGTKTVAGTLPTGQTVPTSFRIAVDQNAKPGTYRVPIEVTYTYTKTLGPDGLGNFVRDDKTVTKTMHVTVHVEDEPRFRVVDTATNASVGDTGPTTLTLKNVGSEPANDARVTVSPQGTQFVVGGGQPVTSYVGEWAVGENRSVTVSSSVAADAEAQNYTLGAQVTYANANGNTRQSDSLVASVRPLAEQTFSLSDVSSTLRSGEEGTLNATVENTGPKAVSNAVVTVSTSSTGIVPNRNEFAVGTLEAGERVSVSFPIDVTGSAEAGPRQVQLGVRYTNDAGETRQSDSLPATVRVAPERDRFTVEPVDGTLTAGASDTVTFRLTNNGDTPVTNVNAKVYADSPVSTGDDQAFVPSLAPGETTNITFSLSASGSALAKTYPVSMDFQYDSGGETKLSNYYQVPLTVTKPTGSGGPPLGLIGGVVAVLLVVAGGYLYYKRQ